MHVHRSQVLLLAKLLSDTTQTTEIRADSRGRLVTLSNEHYNIHQGNFFGIGYFNAAVTNGASIQVIIEVPSTIEVHISMKIAAGGDATMQIYEAVTYAAAGTSITPQNHNRCFPNDSIVLASHTPTGAAGTLVWQEYVPGGTGGATAPGGVTSIDEQAVFCPNEVYMIEATNISGTTNPMDIVASFYEVTV